MSLFMVRLGHIQIQYITFDWTILVLSVIDGAIYIWYVSCIWVTICYLPPHFSRLL